MTNLADDLLAGRDGDIALISTRGLETFGTLRQRIRSRAGTMFSASGKQLAFSFLPNTIDMVTTYLAAITSGHAIGLFPPATPSDRKLRLIQAYRPEIVTAAHGDELHEQMSGLGYRGLAPSGDDQSPTWRRPPEGRLAPRLALLLSTSGSTGTPKLVRLSGASVAANAAGIAHSLGIAPHHRAVTSLPLCYSYGLSVLNSHLAAGSSVIVSDQSPMMPSFWRLVHRHSIVEVSGTPLFYQAIFRRPHGPELPPAVRVLTQAGGRLATAHLQRALALMTAAEGRFFCMYGQTEATARISCLDASTRPEKLGSVGLALPGGRVHVGAPVDGSDSGPIGYTGPNVMMGYATCREDLARDDDVDYLHTGDLGRLDADGFLYLTGRSSRFTKILDRRVCLDDIEEWLDRPGRCAVVTGPPGGAGIVVFTTESPRAMRGGCQALTASLGIPAASVEIREISAIPRTAGGKIDYGQLEKAALPAASAAAR
jgi:long-chain acyl-CoA synthetase